MTILSDTAILAAMDRGEIVIEPFDLANLGGNSYDVHLGSRLLISSSFLLDARRRSDVHRIEIPPGGFTLQPATLYLGSTVEYTESHRHVPYLDGKSSVGRLGIAIHATAGRGDVGFCNHWTLELFVVQPVTIYGGMPIGQLTYQSVEGEVQRVYSKKAGSAYGQLPRNPYPQPSLLYRKLGDTET